jgi:hypothetical protein
MVAAAIAGRPLAPPERDRISEVLPLFSNLLRTILTDSHDLLDDNARNHQQKPSFECQTHRFDIANSSSAVIAIGSR